MSTPKQVTLEILENNTIIKEYYDAQNGGVLMKADIPEVTAGQKKTFRAGESGVYPNAGNLNVDLTDKIVDLYFDGSIWEKVEILIATKETLTADLTTIPNINNSYLSSVSGVYSNFGNIEVYNEKVLFKYISGTWQKSQIESLNGISPEYNKAGLTAEHKKFMQFIKSIKLLQNFDKTKKYFISQIKYKNSGYTGVLIYLKSLPAGAVEFVGEVSNIELTDGKPLVIKNIHSNDANRYIKLEFSKDAPQVGFSLDGTYYQDSLLNLSAFGDEIESRSVEIKTANVVSSPTAIQKEKSYFAEENGVYSNFGNIELWGEKAILSYDYSANKWLKNVYDAGDFSIAEKSTDLAVATFLKRTIQSIKLVEGFDFSKKYFISQIKYKAGGEAGIYLLLRSLPSGGYEFETRINNIDLVKGNQILLEDTARGRKVLLTISKFADDTFSQVVTYYQDSLLGAKAFHDSNYNSIFKPIKTTRVRAPNNNDYAIRNLVHSLKASANYYNRYVIVVPKGTYFEMDIRTGDFIDIEGESAEECIIVLDGTSNKIAPTDLSIGTGGAAINTIDQKYKHIFWHVKSSQIRNLTLKVNDCKYAIHSDAPGEYNGGGNNLILIDNGNIVRLIGIGGWAGQKQSYKDCYFKNKPTTQAIGWHNWNDQNAPASAEFINCKSDNYLINLTELGSGQADVVRLVNCTQVSSANGGIGFYVEPQDSTAPTDVPYNIKLVFEGKELPITHINRANYKVFN